MLKFFYGANLRRLVLGTRERESSEADECLFKRAPFGLGFRGSALSQQDAWIDSMGEELASSAWEVKRSAVHCTR